MGRESRAPVTIFDASSRNGNGRFQQSAIDLGIDLEYAAKLLQSFSNTRKTYSHISRLPEAIQDFARNPHSEIFDGQYHSSLVRGDADVYGTTAGVSMNIC